MPATRSNTRLGHMASSPDVFASSPEPPSRRTRAPTNTDPIDVIVISSDDEDVAPPPKRSALRLRSKGKGKQRAHGADHVIDVETVTDEPKGTKRKGTNGEGSSSERDTKRAKEDSDEVARLKEELRRSKEEIQKAREEVQDARIHTSIAKAEEKGAKKVAQEAVARAAAVERKAKVSDSQGVSADVLEDIVTCEICTLKMWHPYVLPNCGHVFCQSCLTDWLETAATQYRTTHPEWSPHAPSQNTLGLVPADETNPDPHNILAILSTLSMLPPHYRATMHIPENRALWALVDAGVGFGGAGEGAGPKFSCPTCRMDVKSRPVECFRIKDVTRALGDVVGDSDPQEEKEKDNGKDKRKAKGKAKAKVTGDAVWDAFFGRR